MSKVLEYLRNRRSIKNFNNKYNIENKELDILFESIRMSPTSFNMQPYKVYYIKNKEILNELHSYWWKQDSVINSSGILVWTVYKEDYLKEIYLPNQILKMVPKENSSRIEGINKGMSYIMKDRNISFEEWAIRQCYITLGCLMPVAKELGIDTCPIEGYKTSVTNEVLEKYNVIDMKKETIALACVLGKAIEEQNEHFSKNKKRLPLEDLFKII
ncbi:nitroreductase family protein [Spiroplasma turonicum]|uniref:Nitroreductase n=1 Tax=Spiroplasma turonicum TaxID=216946 RepID=A0A0K1P7P9_9MOLU|nr:nitroreductase family protein [Spiroplasma turonicum]AKU80219.1 Nitroreductase [Spiroplasma turonicum]ALX71219.1 Nitroreductase [Spiroplasma turonicum]